MLEDTPTWIRWVTMSPMLSAFVTGAGSVLLCLFFVAKADQLRRDENSYLHRWIAWICQAGRSVIFVIRGVPVRYKYYDDTSDKDTEWHTTHIGSGRSKIITPPVIFDPSHDVRLEIEVPLGYRMTFRSGDPFHPEEDIKPISSRSGPDGAGYWIPLSHLPRHSSPIRVNLYDWEYGINVFDNR